MGKAHPRFARGVAGQAGAREGGTDRIEGVDCRISNRARHPAIDQSRARKSKTLQRALAFLAGDNEQIVVGFSAGGMDAASEIRTAGKRFRCSFAGGASGWFTPNWFTR